MHFIKHAVMDSIKVLPFIFVIYLVIEYLEHKNNTSVSHKLMNSKRTSVIYGSLLGSIPQCGFSVIAADLFSKQSISLGTLIAIFIATSDEAIPLMFSMPKKAGFVAGLVLIKIAIAIAVGRIVDMLYKKAPQKKCEHKPEHKHFHGNCESCDDGILPSAIKHAVRIFLFMLVVNLLIGFAVDKLGEDAFSALLLKDSVLQPFIAALIGLIPNCAASVFLTTAFLADSISFGSLISGLCSGAGVGLLLLFRRNESIKESLLITLLLYIVGAICGSIIHIAMML